MTKINFNKLISFGFYVDGNKLKFNYFELGQPMEILEIDIEMLPLTFSSVSEIHILNTNEKNKNALIWAFYHI